MAVSTDKLPINPYIPKIFQAFLDGHQVIELFAPTGTGKTSGISRRFVADNMTKQLKAYCLMSIPTIVGVNTLYAHVSKQLGPDAKRFGCGAGGSYTKNFDSADLRVCTTQVVINHLLQLYSKKSKMDDIIVVIDEAHHSSAENYVLIYLCDWLIEKGYGLRVLIMTATPSDYDLQFLVATQTFRISRDEVVHHEITEHWLPSDLFSVNDITKCNTPFSSLSDEIMRTIKIACETCDGNGLIFVPGESEAEEIAVFGRYRYPDIQFETIYSSMSREEIQTAIAPIDGVRKIIIATNIAECSVTFDIDFVIDTLCHKEMVMRTRNGRVYGELSMQIISDAARMQRRGRCGRLRNGHYFAMCTRSFNEQMMKHTISSFVNGDKAMSVLNLLRSNMPAFEILRMIPADIKAITQRLVKFGLYDQTAQQCTELGRKVSSFSLPLEFIVLLFKCEQKLHPRLFETCLLVAIIGAKDTAHSPFYYPKGMKGPDKQEFVNDKFYEYFHTDDITGIVRLVCETIVETDWCRKNTGKFMRERFLNEKFFRHVVRMLNQILPRFYDSRPPMSVFDELIQDIIDGRNIFEGVGALASSLFPQYEHTGMGRYIENGMFGSPTYTLDNCRLSCTVSSRIVAFSECAITVPNRKMGFGTITMNILSMALPF